MNRCEFVFKITRTKMGEVKGVRCGARVIDGRQFCRDCETRHKLTTKTHRRYRALRERLGGAMEFLYPPDGPMSPRAMSGRLPTHARKFHVQRVGR